MTNPVRRLYAFVVVAVALLTGLSPVARSETAKLTLAGTTTITATTTSSVVVRVPKDVPYANSPGAERGLLDMRGNGRAIAATLQPLASTEISEAVVFALFNGCPAVGCAASPAEGVFVYRREASGARRAPDGRPILAAGAYRLTVLTDGSPVEVRITLEGVTGAASGNTATHAEGGIKPAAETLAVPVSPIVWSGSADLTFASDNSLLVAYLQQDSSMGAVAGVAGACLFTGAARPLLGVPAPGCPFQPNGGDGSAQVGSVGTELLTFGQPSRTRFGTALTPTTGSQQAGLWSTRVAVTSTPLAFFAWLRLS